MSDGEAGRARHAEVPSGRELGRLRRQELRHSCEVLGIEDLHCFGFPDGELAYTDSTPFVSLHLREFAPHLLITLGKDGVYGHEDHLATTAAVSRAVRNTNIRVLHSAFEKGLFAPLHRNLKRWRPDLIGPNIRRSELGSRREDVDICIDIESVRAQKLAAIKAHHSQLQDGDPMSFLMPGLVEQLLTEERFVLAHGQRLPIGATHPFEGLD
jgi:LmbE family N-acetylglucosaminyl deacetylase